jgi:hypothetical protein
MSLAEMLDRLRLHRARLGGTALACEERLGTTDPLTVSLGDRLIEADELFLLAHAYEADSVAREVLAIATRGQ